ncbi:WD repeat domain-containing protein [Diplocarpon rosae]|nr:WD repeat domain-containing protein [Diplocarpon rosae]
MERNEGIIRWSPNQSRDEFTIFNLNNKVSHLYEATGHAQSGRFDYRRVSKHTELPAVNAYDWSPSFRGLVAVGTAHGEVSLLRIDDNSNACLTLPLKLQRPCQSVSFNTTGLLAVGLDRVRNDSCLQVWDVNQRLAGWDPYLKGWNVPAMNSIEPKRKLEGSTSITSIRFFEDQPQTLIAGVKNQSIRVHDLRDPNSSVLNFQTRCNNNIAIDHTDTNYFASSSLDQPGLVIWDRRVSSRSTASPMYLESFDQDEIVWGSVLKLDKAIEVEKSTFVKQLRFSREQRGALGVLSTAGQLQVLQTKKEYVEPGSLNDVRTSPELLEIKKSYDLEYPFFDQNHLKKFEHRIVSFDWLNLGMPGLPGRVVALRANGEFGILQMPTATASQLSQLIPWKPPHHPGDPYLDLMQFGDPEEHEKVIGPLYTAAAEADAAIFGPKGLKTDTNAEKLRERVKAWLELRWDPVADLLAPAGPGLGATTSSTSEFESIGDDFTQLHLEPKERKRIPTTNGLFDFVTPNNVSSSRELYDQAHYTALSRFPTLKTSRDQLDHVILRRAMDGYLFDAELNQDVVADDPWLQNVWKWIAGADEEAQDDAMMSLPLDLSYMGVYTVWMNILGNKPQSRLIDTNVIPDEAHWERLIGSINKRAGRRAFEGVFTAKPHHRQLCLAICGLLKSPEELEDDLKSLEQAEKYTTAAAMALFEGVPERAVEILKNGGTDLLFVAMALDIKLKSNIQLDLDDSEWGKALEGHTQMGEDAYLRAIYGYITTGNWTAIADSTSLPLRDRVWVALRNFPDDKLTEWLTKEMEEAIRTGDIEGIVLAGITDSMVDILAKYVEKFMDYQTPILIMSFCYPRYIDDIRCDAWRKAYKDFLYRHKENVLRIRFEQQSTTKSRLRDGNPVIKPPPRQVTIRCLNCDANTANDLRNSGVVSPATPLVLSATMDRRNPLAVTGINAGLNCPKCGSHLPRCAICMEIVGMPRSDRPEMSMDDEIQRMANFPTFCLKCKHVQHMEHSLAWFRRHNECPVPECQCSCNEMKSREKD